MPCSVTLVLLRPFREIQYVFLLECQYQIFAIHLTWHSVNSFEKTVHFFELTKYHNRTLTISYLLWWDIKGNSSQINLDVIINTWQNKEDT